MEWPKKECVELRSIKYRESYKKRELKAPCLNGIKNTTSISLDELNFPK